jgi:hypothetical protein
MELKEAEENRAGLDFYRRQLAKRCKVELI